MYLKFLLILLLFVLPLGCIFGQQRGLISYEPDKDTRIEVLPSKAILIANYTYQHTDDYPILAHPSNDCLALKKVLTSKYNFSDVTIYENLDGDSLINLFNKLYAFQGDLFIFYAGHGDTTLDNGGGVSFIVPVDFNKEQNKEGKSELFTYGSLTGKLTNRREQKIQTKHLFFVADACFSGMDDIANQLITMRASISDEQDLETAYMNPAAYYLASSINRPVSDKSWFLENFISILANNENYYISATQINAELTVNRNKADKRSLEQQGITMNTHVFKKMSPYRDGDFIFFKKSYLEKKNETSENVGGGAAPASTKNKKKCDFNFNCIDNSEGKYISKNAPVAALQRNCMVLFEQRMGNFIEIISGSSATNFISFNVEFHYASKKQTNPELKISCILGDAEEPFDSVILSCEKELLTSEGALNWSSPKLISKIASICDTFLWTALGSDKLK